MSESLVGSHVSPAPLICYIFLSIVFVVLIRQRYFSPVSDIPGPRLGTVGTFFQVWQVFRGRINDSLLDLHHKHGPFLRISYNEVSVSHPDATQILAAPLWKGDFYNLFAVPNSSYNNLMSERNPKKFATMRSNIASAFSLTSIIKSEPIIDEVIELMKRRLEERSQRQAPVELGRWIHFLTYDLLGEIMFSNRFGFLDQGRDVGSSINNTFYLSIYVTSMVSMQWLHAVLLGSPILRWLDFQPNEYSYNTVVKSVAARKEHTEARIDMMERWLIQNAKYPDKYTDKEMFSAVIATFGAGGGTVGSALESVFYFLLKGDTKYLRRLQEEVDNARLSPVASFAETQRLPYLQAVIKETLRIWPPVAWNLPRVVPKEGFTVAGQYFKHGAILSVNPWLIHRNRDCFGEDAEVYNPDRWLADPITVKRMEKYWIPFGLGYNSCPGRNVANMELSKITATLIRDFDFRLADPKAEWKYHQLFVTSQSGWPVFVKRRK